MANADSYATQENTTLTATSVLANDTDVNSNVTLTARFSTHPKKGSLTFNSDGTFTYIPATYYIGTDSFTYVATDGFSSSAPATVTITVTSQAIPPTAYPGTLLVAPNTVGSGFLQELNPDGQVVFSIDSQGTLGTVALTNASTGAYNYTPNAGAHGMNLCFRVSSVGNPALYSTATVTVTIMGISLSTDISSPRNSPRRPLPSSPTRWA